MKPRISFDRLESEFGLSGDSLKAGKWVVLILTEAFYGDRISVFDAPECVEVHTKKFPEVMKVVEEFLYQWWDDWLLSRGYSNHHA